MNQPVIMLDSNGDDLSLDSYNAINSLASLTRLYLTQYGSTSTPTKFELDSYLKDVSNDISKIEYIELYGLPVDDSDVTAISGLSSLSRLALEDGNVTDFTKWNNDWSALTQLSVGWNNESNSTTTSFDLAAMVSKSLNLSALEYFNVAFTKITDSDLNTLFGSAGLGSKLKQLDLRLTSATTYSSLYNSTLSNLERLKLRLTSHATYDISADFSFLTKSKIKHLYLEDGDITNLTLSEFSNLERLNIRKSDVKSYSSVSDFVIALNGMSKLTRLDIQKSDSSTPTKVNGVAIS